MRGIIRTIHKRTIWIVILLLIELVFPGDLSRVLAQAQEDPPTPAEVIDAVNALRQAKGIPRLAVHPVLMQIAQTQANGIAAGMPGHWRPNNMTLGQWLISLGYPLSGDLTLDGYRSENWVAARTVEEVMAFWQGDAEHLNTMLSINRSDIGAGVAVGDQVYVVIETALRTGSGQQQYEAYAIMTGIPRTQAAYSTGETQTVADSLIPQYMNPVAVNTARADGDVYHEVKYGQTLWSIAVTYGTTIRQIQQLNNLPDNTIRSGQRLLVLKNATQPAPATVTGSSITPTGYSTQAGRSAVTPSPEPVQELPARDKKQDMLSIAAIAFAALVLGGIFTAMTGKKPV